MQSYSYAQWHTDARGRDMRVAACEKTRSIVTALVAASIAFALLVGGVFYAAPPAYASVYPDSAPAAAAQSENQASGASGEASSDEAASAEEIDDEDVPMAAGPGGGEPVFSTGAGMHWAIVAGIAFVVVFFAVSMFRLNKNISDMRQRLRHR